MGNCVGNLVENSCGEILWENLEGKSDGKIMWEILQEILWEILVENSCRKILWERLAEQGEGEKANLRKAVIGGNLAFSIR